LRISARTPARISERSSANSSDNTNGHTDVPLENAIVINNLKKSYGFKPVLRSIQLTLPAGQCLALLGANGTGKTTILRILAGLAKPDAGTISIFGLDAKDNAQQIRSLVGLVAHQPYLYEELTPLENLHFFARMYNVANAQERAWNLLHRVGVDKRAHDRVHTLSRGLLQRVAWARALLHAPRLLLLDEPDTGLDQDGTVLMDSLLAEHAQQGGSILFTTHQLERALQLADHIVVLGHGKIAYQVETTKLELETLRTAYQEAVR
jgi:heme exporter protein A